MNYSIIRRLDRMGRLCIPKELITDKGLRCGLLIFSDNDKIILCPEVPHCSFCGRTGPAILFKNRHICEDCQDGIKKL